MPGHDVFPSSAWNRPPLHGVQETWTALAPVNLPGGHGVQIWLLLEYIPPGHTATHMEFEIDFMAE